MSDVGIFQVLGSVEKKNYEEVEFVIEGESYRHVFSSLAIKEWLSENGVKAKVFFLVPESLVEQLGEDASILEDRKEYEKAVKEKVGEEAEYRAVSSVGKYGKYEFLGSIDNATIDIFRVAYEEKLDVVVGDASTGLNIYVATLIEALRKYTTYRKLENALQESEKFGMKLAFLPPVLGNDKLNVEVQDVGVRAFFDVPDVSARDAFRCREVGEKFGKAMKLLGKAIEVAKLGCNAINLNVPLAFYHKEILDFELDVDWVERRLWEIIDYATKPVVEGFKVKRKPTIEAVFNLLFVLAIAKSLRKFASILSERAELSELVEKFGAVYDRLGLKVNRRLLERDVENMIEIVPDGFTGLYSELFNSGGSKDSVRNFFAHSGFLREVTFVKREGSRIHVWWNESELKVIRRWMANL